MMEMRQLKLGKQSFSLQKHSYDVQRLLIKEQRSIVNVDQGSVSCTLQQLLTLRISIEYSMIAETSFYDGIWRTMILCNGS
jgi:hypothetical protein